jgi:heme/copper-type cytochrome/quinol oxidase subunit 2
MSRASTLQWIGLFVGPFAWLGQHLIGQAASQASCSAANTAWGMSNTVWQITLLVSAGLLILGSEAAAVVAFMRTREGNHESPPPLGRIQLISVASMCTNLLFLVIVVLDGTASLVDIACRQS